MMHLVSVVDKIVYESKEGRENTHTPLLMGNIGYWVKAWGVYHPFVPMVVPDCLKLESTNI